GWTIVILARLAPLGTERLSLRGIDRGDPLLEFLFANHLAQNGGIRAKRDAVHAAGAVFLNVLWYVRSDIAEVPQRGRAGGNQRAGDRQIGAKADFRRAIFVGPVRAVGEVVHVQ